MIHEAPPLRRDAEANRGRLIAAAVDVFNDEGIDAGVERIAQRAGVGVGTLYRRFPTKDALIAFLVQQMIAELTQAAVDAHAAPGGRGLEQFVRAAADQLSAQRGCLARLWNHVSKDESEIERLRGHIDQLVRDARNAGTIRADTTRADITAIIWCLQGVIENAGDSAQQACTRLLTTMFAGLKPPA
jgi:AcrR family transcriptional regulator